MWAAFWFWNRIRYESVVCFQKKGLLREDGSHCNRFTGAGIDYHPGEFLVFPENDIPQLNPVFFLA